MRFVTDFLWRSPLGLRINVIQLAVLFALSVAAIAYLNWSSNAALTEFMATGKPSASEPGHLPQPGPLQQVKNRTACPRRV
jgi:hypothetical protein